MMPAGHQKQENTHSAAFQSHMFNPPEHVIDAGNRFHQQHQPFVQNNGHQHQQAVTGHQVPLWFDTSAHFAIPVSQNKLKEEKEKLNNNNNGATVARDSLTINGQQPATGQQLPSLNQQQPPATHQSTSVSNPINFDQKIIIQVYGLPGVKIGALENSGPAVFEMTPGELPVFMAEMEKMTKDAVKNNKKPSSAGGPDANDGNRQQVNTQLPPMTMQVFLAPAGSDGKNQFGNANGIAAGAGNQQGNGGELMLLETPIKVES